MKALLSFLCIAPLPLAAQLALPQTIFLDEMEGADYGAFSFSNPNNPDDISYSLVNGEVPTGGNPGAYLEVVHYHDVERDEFGFPLNGAGDTEVQSVHLQNTFTYNPASSGSIEGLQLSFDFSSDYDAVLYFGIGNQNLGSGSIHFGGYYFGGSGWQTFDSGYIDDLNASVVSYSGDNDIEFGISIVTQSDAYDGPVEYNMALDNFRVDAYLVPEPSIAVLSLLFPVALLRRRR